MPTEVLIDRRKPRYVLIRLRTLAILVGAVVVLAATNFYQLLSR